MPTAIESITAESDANNIGEISRQAIERGEQRKRGRHKKDCLCPNCSARRSEQTKTGGDEVSTSTSVTPVDAEMVKQTFGQLLKAIDDVSCRKIYLVTLRATNDNRVATELSQSAALRDSERINMETCVGILAQKYQLAGKYLPEAMLGIGLTVYCVRHVSTHKKLHDLIAASKAIANDGHATPTPTANKT